MCKAGVSDRFSQQSQFAQLIDIRQVLRPTRRFLGSNQIFFSEKVDRKLSIRDLSRFPSFGELQAGNGGQKIDHVGRNANGILQSFGLKITGLDSSEQWKPKSLKRLEDSLSVFRRRF